MTVVGLSWNICFFFFHHWSISTWDIHVHILQMVYTYMYNIWLVVWNDGILWLSIQWGISIHPNWPELRHIFQRSRVGWNHPPIGPWTSVFSRDNDFYRWLPAMFGLKLTEIGLNLIVYHGLWWFIMVYGGLSWFIVVDHDFIHYISGYFQQVMVPAVLIHFILGFSITLW